MRVPESERWDADSTLQMRAAPRPRGSAGGKQSKEDLPFVEQTSSSGVSAKVVLGASI